MPFILVMQHDTLRSSLPHMQDRNIVLCHQMHQNDLIILICTDWGSIHDCRCGPSIEGCGLIRKFPPGGRGEHWSIQRCPHDHPLWPPKNNVWHTTHRKISTQRKRLLHAKFSRGSLGCLCTPPATNWP